MQISATRLCVILSSQFSSSAQLSALSGGREGGGGEGRGDKVRMGLSNPHRTIVAKCKTNNSNTLFPIRRLAPMLEK